MKKYLKYLVLAAPLGFRVLRNWNRLEKEGTEAIMASLACTEALRRAIEDDQVTAFMTSQRLADALKEIREAVDVIQDILGTGKRS